MRAPKTLFKKISIIQIGQHRQPVFAKIEEWIARLQAIPQQKKFNRHEHFWKKWSLISLFSWTSDPAENYAVQNYYLTMEKIKKLCYCNISWIDLQIFSRFDGIIDCNHNKYQSSPHYLCNNTFAFTGIF